MQTKILGTLIALMVFCMSCAAPRALPTPAPRAVPPTAVGGGVGGQQGTNTSQSSTVSSVPTKPQPTVPPPTRASQSRTGFVFHPWKIDTKSAINAASGKEKPGFKRIVVRIALENASSQWIGLEFVGSRQLSTNEGYTYQANNPPENEGCELKTLVPVPPNLLVFGNGDVITNNPACLTFDIGQDTTPKEITIQGYTTFVRGNDTQTSSLVVVDLKKIESNLSPGFSTNFPVRKIGESIDVPDTGTFAITAVRNNLEFDWSVTNSSGGYARQFSAPSNAFYDGQTGTVSIGASINFVRVDVGPKQTTKGTVKPNISSNSEHWWLLATNLGSNYPQTYGVDEIIQLK